MLKRSPLTDQYRQLGKKTSGVEAWGQLGDIVIATQY